MNFKRYHVSRNISDVNTVTSTGWGTANSDMLSVLNSLEAGTYSFSALFTLTERNDTSDNSTYGIVFTNTINNISNNSIKWNDSGVGTVKSYKINLDVTTQMVGKFTNAYFYGCGINQVGRTGRADVSNIMLNTGSTALPYEPYSPEVWHDIPHYIHKTSTDTITTLPADLYANDTTATVGLKGNMSQSSTPSPTTPIQPSECGERTGNLYFKKLAGANISDNGVVTMLTGFDLHIAEVKQGVHYSGAGYIYAFFEEEPTIGSISFNGSRVIDNINNIVSPINGFVAVRTSDAAKNVMLNSGSTPLPYEPYGYKIPILSANTTTPVYLGEVETTRRIKKFVLNGTESEDVLKMRSPNLFYYKVQNGLPLNYGACRCTHYINNQVPNVQLNNDEVKLDVTNVWGSTANVIVFKDTSKATLEGFKTWLQQQYTSGTPVTVWYTLGTPQTAVINEPLMRIGDYADEVSGITIPITAGGDTISVDTTLQPSEMSATYKGWHPVQNVHERDNGAWT